jgi:hypothetical protein
MATYVNDLRLKEIATGDESGTWGTSTNTNLELIAEAFSFGTEAITTNADTHTTTIADGSTDPGRSIYLKYTGTLDSACTITLGPNTVSKLWFIENGTSGSQNIIISQGSGANVTIPPGDVKAVYSDGAGSGAAIVDAFASLNVVDLKVEDDLTVTDDASVGGDLLVSGEVQTANIGFTDGDNAITIADGGGITAAAGITSTAASNTFGATSFNDADITNVGSIALDTITNDGTDITVDSSGTIILDADGAEVVFKDGGTHIGSIINNSSDFVFRSIVQDKDVLIRGNDGGSAITALQLDMSDAGTAIFNNKVGIATTSPGTALSFDAGTNTILGLNFNSSDADGGSLQIRAGAGKGSGNTGGNLNLCAGTGTSSAAVGNILFGRSTGDNTTITPDEEWMRIDNNGNFSFGGGANATNFSGYVTLDLRDSTGGLIDFSEASAGVFARIQGIVNNQFNVTNRQAYPIIFNTNDTERMRISSVGRTSIGTTTTNAGLTVANGDIRASGAAFANDANSTSMSMESGSVGAITARGPDTSTRASMVLTVSRSNGGSGISAIRIENDGKTIVGTDNETSAVGVLEVRDDGADPIFLVHKNSSGATDGMRVRHGRGLSGFAGTGISFRRSDDTEVGKVSIGFTNVTYDTTSDYRLKENVNYSWDATTRLKQLKPARFNFKEETGITLDGFLAHEVQEVVPQAVTGEKDGEQMQGIDHSKLVPLLVKTIQELEARITALES